MAELLGALFTFLGEWADPLEGLIAFIVRCRAEARYERWHAEREDAISR